MPHPRDVLVFVASVLSLKFASKNAVILSKFGRVTGVPGDGSLSLGWSGAQRSRRTRGCFSLLFIEIQRQDTRVGEHNPKPGTGLKGHDFSRAAKTNKMIGGFSPCSAIPSHLREPLCAFCVSLVSPAGPGGTNLLVADAQKEMRTVFVGGFFGQLVSSALWLTSAALATWVTPRAAITQLVVSGFFIFPATQLLLRLSGGPASLSKRDPLGKLGLQIALSLPMTMLLLVPVTLFNQNLFFPAFMILLGAHFLPFTFLYGMRMFIPLCGILVGSGVVIAENFSRSFSVGAWVTGATLFAFAWIGRIAVRSEEDGNQ